MLKNLTLKIRPGDIVEKLAKPIAKALNLSCLDENGNLKPESPCAKRRDRMNRRWQARVDQSPK